MRFGVLGPVHVVASGRAVRIGSARQRAVLAMLLLSPNRTVSVDRMIDAVWGEQPADSALNLLRTYVWRLRAVLAEDGRVRLGTEPSGYRLRVEKGELDLAEFERLAREGRAALTRDEAAEAAQRLGAALRLWHGEPLEDVTLHGLDLAAETQRLSEARVAALEDRIEADLALGRHEDLIGELGQLAALHPLRERISGQLMLAHYRSGRQADALSAYRTLRRALVEDLGVDPGPDIRDLHMRILRADPDLLSGPARARPARSADPIVPRQLPLRIRHFAGRGAQLAALSRLADTAAGPDAESGGAVAISVVYGTAGVGKTALAVCWAHRMAHLFPDGQLFVNLRGFDPAGPPVAPAEAVRGFLDALGVPAARIPARPHAQEAMYRSILATRRVLILLDNARDADQVRPLLPAGRSCAVIVTCRDPLAGLVAAEGAQPVALGRLTDAEAHGLLALRLGSRRMAAEPDASKELLEQCARLPLALSIAAARAALSPDLPLAEQVRQMRDAESRLDLLGTGDASTDVRAAFSWSYRLLSAPAMRMFRLLGIHPGPDISEAAAASLLGVPLDEVRESARELVRAQLTERHGGRLAQHDLLRAYAAELAHAEDGDAECDNALVRALDHYLYTAQCAARLLNPQWAPVAPDRTRPDITPETPADQESALAWFDAERAVLIAAIARASSAGKDAHAWQLPAALMTYLDRRSRWQELAATHRTALASAKRLRNRIGQASAHRGLARAFLRIGAYEESHEHLSQALEHYRRLNDRASLSNTHHDIALLREQQGDYQDALRHARQVLELTRTQGNRAAQANALNTVGWYHALLAEFETAVRFCEQALRLYADLGDTAGEAGTLDSLGYAHHHLSDHGRAVRAYARAVELYEHVGDRYYQAGTLVRLGDAHSAALEPDAARAAWRQALSILTELCHPDAKQVRAKLESITPPQPAPSTSER